MKTPTRHVSALVGITVALSLTLAASSHAALVVVNESFEAWNSATGGNDPTSYQYPEVTSWTYAGGSPYTVGVLGAISETIGSVIDTPYGDNWLLMDSRNKTRHIFQDVGTIALGDQLTLSALIGTPTNALLSDFELGLYRSIGGSGTPDVLLTAITTSHADLVGLGLASSATAAVNYTALAADAGETLFVRVGLLSSLPTSGGVTQTLIDNVSVSVNVVPEPSAAALLGLGGLGLVFRRRRAGA